MPLSPEDRAYIVRHEGYSDTPYDDGEGCSVCWGHRLHDGGCSGSEKQRRYSPEECEAFLAADLAWVGACLDRHVTVPLTDEQRRALASFTFNWGCGEGSGFGATSICALVQAGAHDLVPDEMVHGRGPPTARHPQGRPYDKGLAGVRRRRIEEAELYMTGQPICLADLFAADLVGDPAARPAPGLVAPAMSEGQAVLAPGVLGVMDAVIADLRAQGLAVIEMEQWRTTGRPYRFDPEGLVGHHTADRAYANDRSIMDLLRRGRSDLPGPLSQWGLRRNGEIWVVAAGSANHAGGGGWRGLRGNTSVWGIEACNDGIGEEWGEAILRSYRALVGALGRHGGYAAEMTCCHREWTPTKPDPRGIDCETLRLWAAEEDEDMYDAEDRKKLDRIFAETHDNHRFIAEMKDALGAMPGAGGDWRKGLAGFRGEVGGAMPSRVRVSGELAVTSDPLET